VAQSVCLFIMLVFVNNFFRNNYISHNITAAGALVLINFPLLEKCSAICLSFM
jgi:hypothetical protein